MNTGVKYKQINKNNSTAIAVGVELVASELELLLNMPKYSLFFGNEMGVDLEQYLYLRNREATFLLIQEDIRDAIRKYGKARLHRLTMVLNKDSTIDIIVEVIPNGTQSILQIPLTYQT